MSNGLTRESLNTLIEEIIGVCNYDWLTEESKPAEIERILIDNGIVSVVEEQERKPNLNDKFQLEVDTGRGGYGIVERIEELLTDIEDEFGKEEMDKVSIWAKSSKDGDEYWSQNKRLYICNVGKG